MNRLSLVYLGAGSSWSMPIGLLYLASWVQKYCAGWTVNIVDANWEDPLKSILRSRPDAVGISAMTPQYEAASSLAYALKAAGIGPIILGGVHITTAPWSERPCFDTIIHGEGETKLASLLDGPKPQPVSLVDYPDLDYGLLDARYWKRRPLRVWQESVVEGLLVTSRGCPYSCRFCSTSAFWEQYRAHSPEWVIRQMQSLAEKGVTHIQIFDDLFAADKKRIGIIGDLFIKSGLHKRIKGIGCQCRANLADAEMCALLKRMNVKILSFGLESGSDRVLSYLGKTGVRVSVNKRAIKTVTFHNIRCIGSVMLGVPTETVREMLHTIHFVWWSFLHGVEDIWAFVALPYPGTEFWQEAEQRGTVRDVHKNWNQLRLTSKATGTPRLLDIPLWKFRILWTLLQLSLLPFKAMKSLRLALSLLKRP